MAILQNILFLDIAVMLLILVIFYLSKRLGEALKTPPFYKLFYVSVGFIFVGGIITFLCVNNTVIVLPVRFQVVAMVFRFMGALIAVFAALQYWKWLFDAIMKR